MSNWIANLYETYNRCSQSEGSMDDDSPLLPIFHTVQNTHIEITIDGNGHYLRSRVLSKDELPTVMPTTEQSAGRSGSKPKNFPLCDKLQYLAGDYLSKGGELSGFKNSPIEPFENYVTDLEQWANSVNSHPKIKAISRYVQSSTLISDLIEDGLLVLNRHNKLITSWTYNELKNEPFIARIHDAQEEGRLWSDLQEKEKKEHFKKLSRTEEFSKSTPAVFKILPNKALVDAMVRWRIQFPGVPNTAVWDDSSLHDAWIAFYLSMDSEHGLCMVSGEQNQPIASSHPSNIRRQGDKAKIISSNDGSNYTFRGHLADTKKRVQQVCTISSNVTQKAHNALRWLIKKQGYRSGDQVFVTWAVSGEKIPDPMADTYALLGLEKAPESNNNDTGEGFARRLSRYIAGYQADISDTTNIVSMGLNAATTGRMAITFYRELERSEFLQRIQQWHSNFSWHQNYSKGIKFIGAPSPKDIAMAAYGSRLGTKGGSKIDPKMEMAIVERIFPSIIDSTPIPGDLWNFTFHRVCNRVGMDRWEWKKTLGIACALYRGTHQQENYSMSLERDRTTRDYLYGRLLAVADYIEEFELKKRDEKRPTSAARLMRRFSTHPYQTWPLIYGQVEPYRSKMKTSNYGLWIKIERLVNEIKCQFVSSDDFMSSAPLTGEFLLAYHCQLAELWQSKNKDEEQDDEEPTETEEQS